MRILRVYHAGRDPAHRARERALSALGVDITLVVPSSWPDHGAEKDLSDEPFRIVEMDVRRPSDVNRHTYLDDSAIAGILASYRPDLLDIHEEPVSVAARQWLRAAGDVPVTMYTAQNIDKRFPPPFAQYETAAYRRVTGIYPCSRQAAAVVRGKGFGGIVDVLPLGVDDHFFPGDQRADDEVRLALVGRLVPEKGVVDAVQVLARVAESRPARLLIAGAGPEEDAARAAAGRLGVADRVDFLGWRSSEDLAALYRSVHVLLVPSRATATWVEQFGRIIVEAQASGAVVAGYASGAIPEVGGSPALLVPEGDMEQLGATVSDLLADTAQYDDTRRSGIARARTMSWSSVARQQLALYERTLGAGCESAPVPRSGRERRQLARNEFGYPAVLPGNVLRPFALPVLRRDTALSRVSGRVVDTVAQLAGR